MHYVRVHLALSPVLGLPLLLLLAGCIDINVGMAASAFFNVNVNMNMNIVPRNKVVRAINFNTHGPQLQHLLLHGGTNTGSSSTSYSSTKLASASASSNGGQEERNSNSQEKKLSPWSSQYRHQHMNMQQYRYRYGHGHGHGHDNHSPTETTNNTTATATATATTTLELDTDDTIDADTDTEEEAARDLYQKQRHCYICIITETNSCDSMENIQRTLHTLNCALGTYNDYSIDLISIRVIPPVSDADSGSNDTQSQFQSQSQSQFQQRLIHLATQIMTNKEKHQSHPLYNDYKVVINDVANLQAAIQANVDGIHVKEKDVCQIPDMRSTWALSRGQQRQSQQQQSQSQLEKDMIVGTSAHSIESALSNHQLYKPDYMFVGTCYLTQSHPEKNAIDLEGPALPGLVKEAIVQMDIDSIDDGSIDDDDDDDDDGGHGGPVSPIIFAIGGIERENCHEPVGYGSDGVAVIRSVMQASNPALAVKHIKEGMYAGVDSIRFDSSASSCV